MTSIGKKQKKKVSRRISIFIIKSSLLEVKQVTPMKEKNKPNEAEVRKGKLSQYKGHIGTKVDRKNK
jgi:hypothetical protein